MTGATPKGVGPSQAEPVPVSSLRASVPSAEKPICPRHLYEGSGGWQDGRLGQAYDLIAAAIAERGEQSFRHPLLAAVEAYDIEGKLA